jgi:outer membrane protein TolC
MRNEEREMLRRSCGILASLTAIGWGLVMATGCSPQYYRTAADREVYGILKAKGPHVTGMPDSFTIEQPEDDVLRTCPTAAPVDLGSGSAGELQSQSEEVGEPPTVVISLAKALEIASLNSREYQTQKESLYKTALSLTQQRYAFDPQFFGTASGEYADTDLGDDREISADTAFGFSWLFSTGAELAVSISSSFSKFLTGDPREAATSLFSATITQPLLQGAGISVTEPLTQAERDVVYAIRSFVRFRRTLFVGVLSAYYRVLQQRQVVENEQRNYENLANLRERGEWMSKAGETAEFQVDQIRQDELSAENRLGVARQVYQNRLDEFKITLGLPTEARIVLDPDEGRRLVDEGVVAIDLPPNRLVEIALQSRLDLMTACDRVEDAERKVEVAEDDLLPGLDLSAALTTDTEGDAQPVNFQADRTDYSVGFELDLPLDRLAERNAYRDRLIGLDKQRRDAEELRDQVAQGVRDGWRQYTRTRSSYEIQRASLQLAERRVESSVLLFEAGRADARDVLEAQDDLVRAQNGLANALVDYKVASLELARDMDILVVGNKGQLKESFDEYR